MTGTDSWHFPAGFLPETVSFLRVFAGNSWNTASGIIVLGQKEISRVLLSGGYFFDHQKVELTSHKLEPTKDSNLNVLASVYNITDATRRLRRLF